MHDQRVAFVMGDGIPLPCRAEVVQAIIRESNDAHGAEVLPQDHDMVFILHDLDAARRVVAVGGVYGSEGKVEAPARTP